MCIRDRLTPVFIRCRHFSMINAHFGGVEPAWAWKSAPLHPQCENSSGRIQRLLIWSLQRIQPNEVVTIGLLLHGQRIFFQVNCKELLKFFENKVWEQKKTRKTGLQATGISKTYSLASWKNLSCTGLGNKKMEADSTNDLCEQENSVTGVQCWHVAR